MTPTGDRLPEARLDALREEARRTGRVAAPGTRAAGGPMPRVPDADLPGYWGRPVVKPPVWTWEVPLYFFAGGLGGMAAVIALAAWATGAEPELVRAALWMAVAASVVSPVLLILDLGRPARFLNMLRVFKWRSAMSVGAWILAGFGGAAGAAALLFEWRMRAGPGAPALDAALVLALGAAALLGAALATYTGVLIGATAIPAWFVHARTLPIHFGTAGLGSAAAALELLGFRLPALHALGLLTAAVETGFGLWIELHRHGAADRALRRGTAGTLLRGSGLLAGPVALGLRLAGAVPWAAVAFLAGALVSRYGWMAAGRDSGRDPEATFAAQSDRGGTTPG